MSTSCSGELITNKNFHPIYYGKIFDDKNVEGKEKGTNTRKTKKRKTGSQSHDTSYLVNRYTNNELSIFFGCADIFEERFLRNYGRVDGRTDGCKPSPHPLTFIFQSGGIITIL